MINEQKIFDQPIKDDLVTLANNQLCNHLLATGQGDDYTTGYLLEYSYFKNYYKMIAINLSKQQALNRDPKTIQQVNFAANLNREGQMAIYFANEKAKQTVLDFSLGTVRVL